MKDFLVPLSGALVGGAMALAGTYLQATLTQEKEIASERRSKLEQILESVQMMDYCRLEYTRRAENNPECIKLRPNDKAVAISTLYFPVLFKSFNEVSKAIEKNREAVSRCADLSTPDLEKFQQCVKPFIHDDQVANAIADFTMEAFKQKF